MVIRVYVSGISGNKEVKKRQQRVLMILESKNIPCEIIDITEPGRESDKEFMQQNSKPRGDQKHPLPPQIFNDDEYCGDFVGFDLANENEVLLPFLKMAVPEVEAPPEPQEELDDGSNQPQSESEESEPEPVKRPRPRPIPKPAAVEEPSDNGDGANQEDTDGRNNMNDGDSLDEDESKPEAKKDSPQEEEEEMLTQENGDEVEDTTKAGDGAENDDDSEEKINIETELQEDAVMEASEE